MGRRSGFDRPCRRHVRSMLTAWTLLLQVAVSDADAQTLTPPRKTDVDVKTMTEYWAGCTRSCWEKQKLTQQSPEFLVRSYCACACSRLATRVTAADIAEQNAQGAATPKVQTLAARATELCAHALATD